MRLILVFTTLVTGIGSLLFSFGNVRKTLIGLGWDDLLASLYTPTVDVTVIGLILVTQYLVTAGIAPERLKKANRLLAAAGFAMLGANVIPSVIDGWANENAPAYGRALADAVLPAILIAWSHVGPYLIGLFAEIRATAEAAAREIKVQRTHATEADRAAAAAALEAARTEAAAVRSAADQYAEQIRTDAAEELAAAARVHQDAQAVAVRSERERTDAEHALAVRLADQERTAEATAAGRGREAELLAQRAQAELTEARRLLAQAAADRDAATAERDAAAADRRAAEELLAAAVAPAGPPRTPRPQRDRPAPDPTVTQLSGRMSIGQRVEAWKDAHPTWRVEPLPSQSDLRAFWPGLSSADTISKVRAQLEEEKAA